MEMKMNPIQTIMKLYHDLTTEEQKILLSDIMNGFSVQEVELCKKDPKLTIDDVKMIFYHSFERESQLVLNCIQQSIPCYPMIKGTVFNFIQIDHEITINSLSDIVKTPYQCLVFTIDIGFPIDILIVLSDELICLNFSPKTVPHEWESVLDKDVISIRVDCEGKSKFGVHSVRDINYLDFQSLRNLDGMIQCGKNTLTGKRCKCILKKGDECWQHRELKQMVDQKVTHRLVQCLGVTNKGKQCKEGIYWLNDHQYCYQHWYQGCERSEKQHHLT